jgi:MoxR-like ATPase
VTAQPLVGSPFDDQLATARERATYDARALVGNVERVVHGRRHVVDLVVSTVLAGGHVLVEDLPGAGKTTLAKAVARSLDGSFRRVQGTADLLPSDLTGSAVWRTDRGAFEFVEGPLFANVVLVDEINRMPPRTQSALLEAMDEGGVTVDGVRHQLPQPFVVLATQNPVEHFGTYPLPDGQLDRFAVMTPLGANARDVERRVVREQLVGATVDALPPVVDAARLVELRAESRRTHVAETVLDYAVRLAEGTRVHPAVAVGASTRGALALVRCAQAAALLRGRAHVTPDDVRSLAVAVLAHRIQLHDAPAPAGGRAVVTEIVQATPVPVPC